MSLKVSFESQSRFSNEETEKEKEDVERGSWEKLVLIRNSSLAEHSHAFCHGHVFSAEVL